MEVLDGHQFYEKFLEDVKENNTYSIKENLDKVKSFDIEGLKYSILKCACQNTDPDTFDSIMKKIYPLEDAEVSEIIFYCACIGNPMKNLGKLMDYYPKIIFTLGKISIRRMEERRINPTFELFIEKDDQVVNVISVSSAKHVLILLFRVLEKYSVGPGVESIREFIYKLAEMPVLFNGVNKRGVDELVWVLLRFNECNRAQKLLEGTDSNKTKTCFSTSDTQEIFYNSSVEAIKLLMEYYYHDASSALDPLVVGGIFGRINVLLLPVLIDMVSERELFGTSHVQRYFVSAYVKYNLANLRLLYERHPEIDVLKDIPSVAHYPDETPEGKEAVDWVLKMIPHKKRKI